MILQQSWIIVAAVLYFLDLVKPGALLLTTACSSFFLSGFVGLVSDVSNAKEGKSLIKKYKIENKIKKEIFKNIEFNELEIRNLNYSVENKQIFKNFNLEFKKNKKYLIVRESGKGKSTLFRIIFGIIKNHSGDIFINKNINYKDLSDKQIKKIISYLPQQPTVFDDSIRNNVNLWDKSIKDEKILEALKKVNLLNIDKQSLDTKINPDNKNFSGGEVQRMAIARALVEDKQIIIMYEITASLDKFNRKSIEDLVGDLNKTVLYISHTTELDNKNFDYVIKL
ncbi:ATP-binding cassette domain-containing protein [Spiroplasma tabanidicola]|uniref:ATP-binding cassette domain-containing protein n=1 Tax=Spiroplasma tabanidicola TaxID=324079 RepID=UPI0012DBD224|nr:ABC transporter ATP-binding protein [Spiroplasma tabanidicola]